MLNKNVLNSVNWFGNGLKYMLTLSITFENTSAFRPVAVLHLVLNFNVVNLWHFGTDPDPRIRTTDLWIRIRIHILLFSSVAIKMSTKNKFLSKFFAYYLLKVHLNQSSKMKNHKKLQNSRNRVFSYFFLFDNGRIRIQAQTNNDGPGSWRPKNIRILLDRIQIHNTGFNYISFN